MVDRRRLLLRRKTMPAGRAITAWALTFLAVLGLILLAPAALAQDYRFVVSDSMADVYLNADGTVLIIYDLTFMPDPGSHPIDVVDIGLPNSSYSLSDIRASIDGAEITAISQSPYVKPGVAVELGSHTIQPGEVGTLHLEATVRDLFYQDSEDSEYASFEFTPTWFDSSFVHGTTRQQVNFHFPPGLTEEEPRYHDQQFTSAAFLDDRVVYTWSKEDADSSRKNVYGISFPKKYVAEGVVQKPPSRSLNINLSEIGSVCASPVCWGVLFVGLWVGSGILGTVNQKRRKMKYLPPALGVEGVGVKRGLTAVEAAILLEAPLNKVVTMILFSLVKKGQIVVESQKPLKIQVTNAPAGDTELREYEKRFLSAIGPEGTLAEKELRELVIDLIVEVNKKLTSFNRKETVAYYKDIVARAWQQVEAADTPEVLGERWGDGLEWTMLDQEWDDRTRRVFHDRPVVLPHWWWGYQPWGAGRAASGPIMPSAAGPSHPVTLPTLPGADFANTVVSGIENTANTVVRSVEGFASGVTQKTNPPPKVSSSSTRSGGGHSCACACACAGCACACAGGGR
jgi:hypothetical protein